jgi:hypothetical protein
MGDVARIGFSRTTGHIGNGFRPDAQPRYGQVVGGHTNADGARVPTPAEAAGVQDISPEDAARLGNAVSTVINSGGNTMIMAVQFWEEGVRAEGVESMSLEQRAQHLWDSLSGTVEGESLQATFAHEARVHVLGIGTDPIDGPAGREVGA